MNLNTLRSSVWLLAALLASPSLMANDMNPSPQIAADQAVTDEGLPSFYPQLKQQMTYSDSWLSGNFTDFSQWQSQSRKTLRSLLLTPDSTKDFAPQAIENRIVAATRQKRSLLISPMKARRRVAPDAKSAGPHPAVILLHDHGAKFDIGKEKMIKPWGNDEQLASAQAWADKFFTGRFVGDELAKRGYVVLAVDALGWGSRGPIKYEQQQALASNFFNLGRSLAGLMAYEDMRATDFLASLEQVDKQRIGVVGFSMGAYRAWQLAALSDKVAATAAVS